MACRRSLSARGLEGAIAFSEEMESVIFKILAVVLLSLLPRNQPGSSSHLAPGAAAPQLKVRDRHLNLTFYTICTIIAKDLYIYSGSRRYICVCIYICWIRLHHLTPPPPLGCLVLPTSSLLVSPAPSPSATLLSPHHHRGAPAPSSPPRTVYHERRYLESHGAYCCESSARSPTSCLYLAEQRGRRFAQGQVNNHDGKVEAAGEAERERTSLCRFISSLVVVVVVVSEGSRSDSVWWVSGKKKNQDLLL